MFSYFEFSFNWTSNSKTLMFILPLLQPDREDEHARIEAAGGKVIQWNGSRVFGVLAMSRSIGRCF